MIFRSVCQEEFSFYFTNQRRDMLNWASQLDMERHRAINKSEQQMIIISPVADM
jgi:hypothetical protein